MKKILILFAIVIIIVSIISFNYTKYIINTGIAQRENSIFEEYYQKEIYGTDLTTIINKAVDKNIRNEVQKDEKNYFIENDKDSINIDIKITDNDEIYAMENLYNGGMRKFVQYYGTIKFKCTRIEYHSKTKKIKYMYFEQIS